MYNVYSTDLWWLVIPCSDTEVPDWCTRTLCIVWDAEMGGWYFLKSEWPYCNVLLAFLMQSKCPGYQTLNKMQSGHTARICVYDEKTNTPSKLLKWGHSTSVTIGGDADSNWDAKEDVPFEPTIDGVILSNSIDVDGNTIGNDNVDEYSDVSDCGDDDNNITWDLEEYTDTIGDILRSKSDDVGAMIFDLMAAWKAQMKPSAHLITHEEHIDSSLIVGWKTGPREDLYTVDYTVSASCSYGLIYMIVH